MSQPVAPSIEYRRFVPADANLLAEFLSAGDWPYFSGGTPDRGAGLGTRAVRWLTGYLFTEFPGIRRIEGTTRVDNHAMRRTFRSCGYVKESHWRQAWPGRDGTIHDAVGYAILRTDWETGTITRLDWDDEPGHGSAPRTQQS